MRLLTCLLLAVTMIWCGLHIAEPIGTHSAPFEIAASDHPAEQDHGSPDQPAHASHHCPIAPDQMAPAAADGPCHARTLVFVPVLTRLSSLSQAPPLQPPSV